MNKYFDIVVNEHDETGIDFNSCVDRPAHGKQFISFGKDHVKYHFNEEKRIVTGVAIASNIWIYRKDEQSGEHYVKFSPETIETIRRKFFLQGFNNNVNVDHDMNKVVKGAVMIDSYLVYKNDSRYPSVPEAFKNQDIQDGSWIVSYYVTDDKLWSEVKNGRVLGFSIEGWFDKKKVNVKSNKMSKQKKPIGDYFRSLFGIEEEDKVTMAQVTTADGTVLMYEGELAVGTQITAELAGAQVTDLEGDHEVTLEDGTVKVITLDAAGIVTEIKDVEVMDDTELAAAVATQMKAMAVAAAEKFTALETKFETRMKALEIENASLKAQIAGGKFKVDPKKTTPEEVKGSYKDLLNPKKQTKA